MKISEILFEFDQAKANQALHTAMLKLATIIRKYIPQGDAREGVFFGQAEPAASDLLYRAYMRKSFEKPFSFSNKEWIEALKPYTKNYPELHITGQDNPSGHFQFDSSIKNKLRKLEKSTPVTKKLYFTLDPNFKLEQLPKVMDGLLKYLADEKTGARSFKIANRPSWMSDNGVNDESDTLCVYLMNNADIEKTKKEIKSIFPSVERPHRTDSGFDHKQFVWARNKESVKKWGMEYADEESDSTIRYKKFVEHIWNSREFFKQLLKKDNDEQVAGYLEKIWNRSFARGDMSAPIPPEKGSTTNSPPAEKSPANTPGDSKPVVGELTLSHGGKEIHFNIGISISKEIVKKFGEDSKFWDRDQFKLEKTPENTWKLIPNPGAVNKTMIDGVVVTSPVILKKGMRVAVGNPAKKVEKLPLTVG